MEVKISKAQLDIWEWKEKAYEAVKHLPVLEQIKLIHEQTKKTVEHINSAKGAVKPTA